MNLGWLWDGPYPVWYGDAMAPTPETMNGWWFKCCGVMFRVRAGRIYRWDQ